MLHEVGQRYGVDIFYADREQRARYASALARYAAIPEEVVRFALLGDEQYGSSYGAARNALLLHSKGEVCLQTDDDMIGSLATIPEITSGLRLHSRGEVNEYWFFKDHEAVLASLTFIDADILGVHEQVLGKKLRTCLSALGDDDRELCFDEIDYEFLKNMCSPEARVAVSFTGIAGDSGSRIYLHRLLSEGNTYERLVHDAQEYRVKLNTHQILRTSRQPTISDDIFCMAGSMGLDNRVLLPPFMPTFRSEDGVFSSILKKCLTSAYRGLLPHLVLHAPPVPRPPSSDAVSIDLIRNKGCIEKLRS